MDLELVQILLELRPIDRELDEGHLLAQKVKSKLLVLVYSMNKGIFQLFKAFHLLLVLIEDDQVHVLIEVKFG